MTYMETRKLVKQIVLEKGIENIINADILPLYDMGCTGTDIQNAMSYFKYSPKAKKYR